MAQVNPRAEMLARLRAGAAEGRAKRRQSVYGRKGRAAFERLLGSDAGLVNKVYMGKPIERRKP